MTVYLVRRYEDHLNEDDYGVDDNYYLVGIYTTERKAQYAVRHLKANEILFANEIVEVEIDHTYPTELQPWLGGGAYVE